MNGPFSALNSLRNLWVPFAHVLAVRITNSLNDSKQRSRCFPINWFVCLLGFFKGIRSDQLPRSLSQDWTCWSACEYLEQTNMTHFYPKSLSWTLGVLTSSLFCFLLLLTQWPQQQCHHVNSRKFILPDEKTRRTVSVMNEFIFIFHFSSVISRFWKEEEELLTQSSKNFNTSLCLIDSL